MRLSEIQAEETIFIDTNIFVYHFTGVSDESTLFLKRCENGELAGVTGMNILIEVLHRLMMVEAVINGFVRPGNVVKKLKKKPDIVKKLTRYQTQTLSIMDMGITVLPLARETIQSSFRFREECGLLVNDSFTAAMINLVGMVNLATMDKDFERVEGVRVYSPQDILG